MLKCGKDGHTSQDCHKKVSVDKPREKQALKRKSVRKIQTYKSKSKGRPSLEKYGIIEEFFFFFFFKSVFACGLDHGEAPGPH